MSFIYWLISLIGRGCVAAIFVTSGVEKILMWDQTLDYMSSHGLPFVEVLLFLAAAIEVFAGLALFLGIKRHLAAALLALYLIPVTYVFHNFWMISDSTMQMVEYINFMKNLAIFGGLVCLAVPAKKEAEQPKK